MRVAVILLATIPFCNGSAFGWGCQGHQIVALIARAHLTPAASAAVDRLLRENPIDASLVRFCKDRPDDPMADAATWADDQRNVDKSTETWHFIDIPLAVHSGSVPEREAMKWCAPPAAGGPGCIVSALDDQLATMRDGSRPSAARAQALRYVIHFAGDIAQPLHASDNHDQGGNCTSIAFFAEQKPRNLHAIWDTQFIARALDADHLTQPQYARKLDERFAGRWAEWGEPKANFLAWAWDSHSIAESVAYGDLKPRIPTEPAGAGQADKDACSIEREQVSGLHISIGDSYDSEALPVIREQLAKAGYRLAGLLNSTFQ
jgi:S1/P1 Nuclease